MTAAALRSQLRAESHPPSRLAPSLVSAILCTPDELPVSARRTQDRQPAGGPTSGSCRARNTLCCARSSTTKPGGFRRQMLRILEMRVSTPPALYPQHRCGCQQARPPAHRHRRDRAARAPGSVPSSLLLMLPIARGSHRDTGTFGNLSPDSNDARVIAVDAQLCISPGASSPGAQGHEIIPGWRIAPGFHLFHAVEDGHDYALRCIPVECDDLSATGKHRTSVSHPNVNYFTLRNVKGPRPNTFVMQLTNKDCKVTNLFPQSVEKLKLDCTGIFPHLSSLFGPGSRRCAQIRGRMPSSQANTSDQKPIGGPNGSQILFFQTQSRGSPYNSKMEMGCWRCLWRSPAGPRPDRRSWTVHQNRNSEHRARLLRCHDRGPAH